MPVRPETPGSRTSRPDAWWRRGRAFLTWLGGRESLPAAPGVLARTPSQDLVHWLAAAETLPGGDLRSGGPADHETGFLTWLFRPEPLPETGPAGPGGERFPGLFHWLFGREPIPPEAPGAVEAGEPSFVAWLFRRESLPGPGRPVRKEEA